MYQALDFTPRFFCIERNQRFPPEIYALGDFSTPGARHQRLGLERDLIAMAETVEAKGYDSVWVGDSMLQKSRLEALTTLSAIAMRTERVKLGTAALIAPLRHTIWLATTWACLDRLSGGRSIFGVCVGAKQPTPGLTGEFAAAGAHLKTRGAVMTEQLEIIKRLWAGERLDYDVGQKSKKGGRWAGRKKSPTAWKNSF